jgi:predicted DNA-binding transcriptional regulator AlpA
MHVHPQPVLAAASLVDVPCRVLERSSSGAAVVIVLAGGRRVVLSARQVAATGADFVTVPAWLAREQRLLTLDACIGVEAIAARFGTNRDWVYRHLAQLTAEEGFPAPVSSLGRRRWDPQSVDAWFARHHPDRAAFASADQASSATRMAGQLTDAELDAAEAEDAAAIRAGLAEHYGRAS